MYILMVAIARQNGQPWMQTVAFFTGKWMKISYGIVHSSCWNPLEDKWCIEILMRERHESKNRAVMWKHADSGVAVFCECLLDSSTFHSHLERTKETNIRFEVESKLTSCFCLQLALDRALPRPEWHWQVWRWVSACPVHVNGMVSNPTLSQ